MEKLDKVKFWIENRIKSGNKTITIVSAGKEFILFMYPIFFLSQDLCAVKIYIKQY